MSKVVDMGPLVSLILASDIRLKFQMINRDLINQFHVLGLGEQLVVSWAALYKYCYNMMICHSSSTHRPGLKTL